MSFARVAKASLPLLVLAAGLAGCSPSSSPSGPDLHLTLQLSPGSRVPAKTALAQARETILQRIEQLGIEGAEVETAGPDRLSVRLPGVENPERVRRLVGSDASLELRFIRVPSTLETLSSEAAVLEHLNGQLPPDLEILWEETRGEGGKVVPAAYYAVEKKPVITAWDIQTARPSMSEVAQPIVIFQLKPAAAATFSEATAANIGKRLAIVLDRRVVSAPVIQDRIQGGHGVIEGGFTSEEAMDLAILLSSGPLPVPFTVVEERVVDRSGA